MASFRCLAVFGLLALVQIIHAQQPANNPGTCPQDDGKYRTDGKTPPQTYKINCDKKLGGQELSRTLRPTLGGCIDMCSFVDGCKSIDYTAASRTCIFYAAGTKGTTVAQGTHNAYVEADPSQIKAEPPQPQPGQQSSSQTPSEQPPSKEPPANVQQPIKDNTSASPSPSSAPSGASPNQPGPNITTVTSPKCPSDDGKAWVGDDGTWYQIQCRRHVPGNALATHNGVDTFEQCLQKCTQTSGCISAQWVAPSTGGGYVEKECVLSDGEGPGTRTCAHWFAYTIPPPVTTEEDAFPYTLCETACPISDGMIFESETGENFKMSCGKRHGTRVLWTQTTETFDECMDICGKVLPCHSVDYQQRTKKCYLGDHHGPPGVSAPGFASATTMGCAGACKRKSCCDGK